jgi:dTDP-L-rhamnose 4-epimerase
MRVLVTGGAGFIGSHLVDALVARGYDVRVLDKLEAQVHGDTGKAPAYLSRHAEVHIGDVRDPDAVARALEGVEVIFHQAAAVGVGQSMYEIARYISVNSLGAATLLQGIAERRDQIKKIIVASSMSIYGEGAYRNKDGDIVYPPPRSPKQLESHSWELTDEHGGPLVPVATTESKHLAPSSIYAISKRDHEELFLVTGAAYGIPAVALRYFNTYGPRQALSNPYTGLLAVFCSQLMNRQRPLVFEDGHQSRDFVHVSDIVQANLLALDNEKAAGRIYNVATGRPTTVLEVADMLSRRFGFNEPPDVVDRYRAGDIRHCFADIGRIKSELGFRPKVSLDQGLEDLILWLKTQQSGTTVRHGYEQLRSRALVG